MPYDRLPDIEQLRNDHGESQPYGWFLCERCGNAAPNKQPNRAVLSAYWDTNRNAVPGEDSEASWQYRRQIADIGARRSWDAFAGLYSGPQPGRFLDIACGLGFTVRYFQDRGWAAMGNDTDQTMKSHHDRLGIDTVIGQVEDITWKEPFDLIQVAYALYFITEPMDFLRRVRGMLAPDGHLAIVLADLLAYTQAGGPSYVHSWLPTIESLEQALALAGFRVVSKQRIKDSWFVAATPGEAHPAPPPITRILWRHRTRALRWRLLGAPRQWLSSLARRLVQR